MGNLFANLQQVAEQQREAVTEVSPPPTQQPSPTQDVTPVREESRALARAMPRNLPTRDEIQEFSFRLRDDLKVKVQAEVPAQWQDELENLARDLKVKKLELYRFILGEFLGKVKRTKK